MPTEYRFDSADAAARDLARHVAGRLSAAIADRGVATLALSGGRSPRAMLEALRTMPLDWAKLIVVQVDERWVEADHPDSNQRLIREALLTGPAAAARLVAMKNDAPDAYRGQPACEAAMAALPWPLDIVLLGMGEDGHTASLFPGAAELHEGLTTSALTLAVTPPAAPHQRLSLSRRAILSSREILLQIGGSAKEAVYWAALAGGAVEEMPIRAALLQDQTPVTVWISA
ncbi:MAG: 6-phosphogluconolactonase [Sphingobium sp.]|nr:6-phosphogluconolactonase [Sphingobium sp.]